MYVKLFSSILTSSVWSEDIATRIVWITLLAMSDKDGDVRASPSGLARIANVTVDDCHRAVTKFLAPDPESSTQEHEGRRLEECAGGWHIINYVKYRGMVDEETRKGQWRENSQRYRERHQKSSVRHRKSSHTDTEVDTKATTSGEPEHNAASLPVTGDVTPSRVTWLTPYLLAWEETYGQGSGATLNGQMAKAFGPLRKAHGEEEVLRRLRHYLGATEARFASPTQFAQKFAGWDAPPKGQTDKITQGRAALLASLKRHEVENGEPSGYRQVSAPVARALPNPSADGSDG